MYYIPAVHAITIFLCCILILRYIALHVTWFHTANTIHTALSPQFPALPLLVLFLFFLCPPYDETWVEHIWVKTSSQSQVPQLENRIPFSKVQRNFLTNTVIVESTEKLKIVQERFTIIVYSVLFPFLGLPCPKSLSSERKKARSERKELVPRSQCSSLSVVPYWQPVSPPSEQSESQKTLYAKEMRMTSVDWIDLCSTTRTRSLT